MTIITKLPIAGPGDEPIPNLFFQQEIEAATLAVLLPGLNYTCDMPLLYYSTRLLEQRGADVLQLHADYVTRDFQAASPLERLQRLSADAQAVVESGLTRQSYTRLVLVGKSIGTLALASLMASPTAANAITIWLTPLLGQPWLVEAAMKTHSPALFVAGTADSTFDAAALKRIQDSRGAEAILVEGANHSLEIPGDPWQSIQKMGEIMQGLAGFLDRALS
jgi:predicted alpha/beta-hydrolase family hydrolase